MPGDVDHLLKIGRSVSKQDSCLGNKIAVGDYICENGQTIVSVTEARALQSSPANNSGGGKSTFCPRSFETYDSCTPRHGLGARRFEYESLWLQIELAFPRALLGTLW